MKERNFKIMEKITMNVQELVKATADKLGTTQKMVKEILGGLDEVIKAQLAEASEGVTVEVKVLNGLTLVSEYCESHEGRNPATGETITVPGKNRVKARIGQAMKAAVNA